MPTRPACKDRSSMQPWTNSEPSTSCFGFTVGTVGVWPPNDDAPQAERRVGARGEVCVEWDGDGERRRDARSTNEHDGQPAVMLVDKPIAAIIRPAFKRPRDRAKA